MICVSFLSRIYLGCELGEVMDGDTLRTEEPNGKKAQIGRQTAAIYKKKLVVNTRANLVGYYCGFFYLLQTHTHTHTQTHTQN
jgi:hypothetical protein